MTGTRAARIVIVDDEPIIRDGLTMYLDGAEGVEVVARLSNGAEVLDYLSSHQVDLVLMDVRMPVMDGPTALLRISERHPGVKVLLMTSFDDEEVAYQVLSEGGHGYLLKSSTPEEIRAGVRAALSGGVPVSPAVNARILQQVLPRRRHRDGGKQFGLTSREHAVLELLCQAASNRDIAVRLSLSESTVKAYVSSIMLKMGCTSRVHVVVTAFEHGMVAQER